MLRLTIPFLSVGGCCQKGASFMTKFLTHEFEPLVCNFACLYIILDHCRMVLSPACFMLRPCFKPNTLLGVICLLYLSLFFVSTFSAHTSMIYTIYVKSYLHPDKKRDSKRKTEEVKVEASEGHMHLKKHKDKLSVQHVFTPVSFKFNKALEYSGITADVIKDKQLQIDVCITQRYSHRSFMIGMLLLPLKTAVKKVVKEKFALIPCMNHTIPTNMRVYSASEMHITSNAAGIFYSNPNVRVTIPEDIDDNSEKAVSNPDLKHEYSSSTEVDMTEESRIFQKLDFSNMTLDESGYSSEHQVPCPGELESPGSEIGKNIVQEIQAFTTIDMGAKKAGSVKKLFQSAKQTMSPSDKNIRKLSTCEVIEIEFGDSESETPRETKGGMGQDHTGEKGSGNKSGDSSSSRPDTLSWDYYDIPIDSPSVIVENPPHRKEAAPVLLPMETSLEVRQKKSKTNLFGIKKEKEKSKRKSKKTEAPIPGRAIPLVPQIVVVSPDEKLVIDSTKIEVPDKTHTESKESHIPETKVTIKDTTETLAVKTETADSVLKEVTVVKRVPGKLKKAKFVIPKMDKSDKTEMPKEQLGAQPHAPPRLKKKRSKEIAGSEKALQMPVKQTNLDFGDLNRNTKAGTGASSAPVFPSFLENQTFHRSDSNNSAISRSLSATSNSSVIVDVDKLSFASSDSHIVELDQDICITELPSDSELFSDLYSTSSEIKSSRPKDVEKGFDEFTADSERFSPTKQVMPMQVFVEESLDSSDEASSHSFTKGLPTTEL